MDVDSQWVAAAVFMVSLILLLVLAAAEGALSTISRSRVRGLIEQGVSGAEVALRLLEDVPTLRRSLALLNLLLVALIVGGGLIAAGLPNERVVPVMALLLLATLAVQTLAAAVGTRWYRRVAPALAPLVNVLLLVLTPLRAGLSAIHRRLAGSPQLEDEEALRLGEEELRLLASVVGEEETVLPEEGREMIYSIVTLGQTTVREVMVPRPDIVALRSSASMMESLDIIIREGHSRIPVYEENVDNIVGVLYAKDLLAYLRDGRTGVPIRDVLRPALFVPESRMAGEVLEDLQGRHVHLAIVFDEYGGTAGLVTIEDILEEIVGEIQDEYDAEEASFVRENEYEAIVSGRYDIDDLNHEMGLALPTDENDTIGGLIYSALGRVPLVGDEVPMEEAGVTFRVVAMVGRRIATVRVMLDRPSPDDDAPAEPLDDETAPDAAPDATRPGPDNVEIGISRILFLR